MRDKRTFDPDQAEIDRVLSTIDSIHGSFNRSLLMPHNQVYSTLYGNDDASAQLMRTFCQRRDHYDYCYRTYRGDIGSTQRILCSLGHGEDTDGDDDEDIAKTEGKQETDDDEKGKKNSYDSGYGSLFNKPYASRDRTPSFSKPSNLN
jgi:hypothetical protein